MLFLIRLYRKRRKIFPRAMSLRTRSFPRNPCSKRTESESFFRMTTTAATVKALPSGEFSAIADATIDAYIARAKLRLSTSSYGALYEDAVLYLTAHLLSLDTSGTGAAPGQVTSESAGSMSRSYATPTNNSSSGLTATHWGRTLIQMQRELFLTPLAL
jgi:hypothetical protein